MELLLDAIIAAISLVFLAILGTISGVAIPGLFMAAAAPWLDWTPPARKKKYLAPKYFGPAVRRREDPRLLRGEGRFVDDVSLPNLLHAAFLRSPHAHARLARLDLRAARAIDGV